MTTFTTSFTNSAGDAWATVTEVIYVTTYRFTGKSHIKTLTLKTTVDAASTGLLTRLTQLSSSSSSISHPNKATGVWAPQPPEYHQPEFVPLDGSMKAAIGISVAFVVVCWLVILALHVRRRRKAQDAREASGRPGSVTEGGAPNQAFTEGQLLTTWKGELNGKSSRAELGVMQQRHTGEWDNATPNRSRAELDNAISERQRAELEDARSTSDRAEIDNTTSPKELDGFVLVSTERYEVAASE